MPQSLHSTAKLLSLAAAVSFATACATVPPAASAQGNVATNIPVLVMSEDSDPNSVKRSSTIFKRVIAELQGAMQRHGFRMLDEESLASDLEWTISDRRSKRDLIDTVKLINKGNVASHQFRAWVLFRIYAQAKKLSFATKVRVRIDGEVYDAASNQFLGTFEWPSTATSAGALDFPAPANCLEQDLCITEVVGDRAREIASALGEVMARKLERYSPPRGSGSRAGSAVTGDRSTARDAGHGMVTPYTLTLRYFQDREALTIVGVMAEEFPGYRTHDFVNKSPTVRRYQYLSTAKRAKLEEWLYILLTDMGFDTNSEVQVTIQGTEILVDKINPTTDRPESPDESKRFK
jgi:hypothetical protein